jgi:Na+-translocating ferredoxin:NAD+ oxidoreductase RnfC subunit
MKEQRFYLRSSEWLLTGSLILLLLSLLAIAKIKAFRAGEAREDKLVTIEVFINGHVKKPGVYAAKRGMPIGEVVKKAQPKKFADLRAVTFKEAVSSPLALTIKPLEELVIHVEGAVENPGPLLVSCGTRISDLKKILTLNREADLAFFKKKRLLQDGEIIKIPLRKD